MPVSSPNLAFETRQGISKTLTALVPTVQNKEKVVSSLSRTEAVPVFWPEIIGVMTTLSAYCERIFVRYLLRIHNVPCLSRRLVVPPLDP